MAQYDSEIWKKPRRENSGWESFVVDFRSISSPLCGLCRLSRNPSRKVVKIIFQFCESDETEAMWWWFRCSNSFCAQWMWGLCDVIIHVQHCEKNYGDGGKKKKSFSDHHRHLNYLVDEHWKMLCVVFFSATESWRYSLLLTCPIFHISTHSMVTEYNMESIFDGCWQTFFCHFLFAFSHPEHTRDNRILSRQQPTCDRVVSASVIAASSSAGDDDDDDDLSLTYTSN